MIARVLVAVTTFTTIVAQAGTPPAVSSILYDIDKWSRQSNGEWKYRPGSGFDCDEDFAKAKADGVPDSFEVELTFDTPDLPKGKYPLHRLRDVCMHSMRSNEIDTFLKMGLSGLDNDDGENAARCITMWEKLVASGVSPTARFPYEGMSAMDPATGDPFVGTFEEMRKKFCDGKAQKFIAARDAEQAPYRKVLKADKLEIALKNINSQFFGPGKKPLKTPAAMAKANVWLRHLWSNDRECRDGRPVHTVRRYKFDAKHVLINVDEGDKTFCGEPPKSAFK